MKKSGIVTQINNRYVCLMTSSGEFVKVKFKGHAPTIGEIYTGDVYAVPKFKTPLIAASMAFILFSGGIYSYFTPAYAVTVEINPSLKLHVNMWNKIVKAEALNEDGEKLLSSLSVTNMNIDGGLEAIVSEAKEDNFIDETYTTTEKAVKVTIEGTSIAASSLKHFTETLKEEKINLQIIKNGAISQQMESELQPKTEANENDRKSLPGSDKEDNTKDKEDKTKDADQTNDKTDKNKDIKDTNNKDNDNKDNKEIKDKEDKKDKKQKEDNGNSTNKPDKKDSANKKLESNSENVYVKNNNSNNNSSNKKN
jgi:hypothetical protein